MTQPIRTGESTVKVIACDGNQTNRAFFKWYETLR